MDLLMLAIVALLIFIWIEIPSSNYSTLSEIKNELRKINEKLDKLNRK